MKKYKFAYKSIIESEELMYDDIKSALSENGISGKFRHEILLAVSEAFTNALIHGNKYNKNKGIEIILKVNKDELTADIIDEGDGDIDDILARLPSTSMQENGRGVDLISAMADEVNYFRDEKTCGLRLHMKFCLLKRKKELQDKSV